jgi:hypothetical protein
MLIMILLVGHFAQMVVWAICFMVAGEFGTFAMASYHRHGVLLGWTIQLDIQDVSGAFRDDVAHGPPPP